MYKRQGYTLCNWSSTWALSQVRPEDVEGKDGNSHLPYRAFWGKRAFRRFLLPPRLENPWARGSPEARGRQRGEDRPKGTFRYPGTAAAAEGSSAGRATFQVSSVAAGGPIDWTILQVQSVVL